MNKKQFIESVKEIDTEYCKSESSPLDTTRIFFFEKSQTVVLIDNCEGFKKCYKTTKSALSEIQGWINSIDFQSALDGESEQENLDIINSQEFAENEKAYLLELERESQYAKSPFSDFFE